MDYFVLHARVMTARGMNNITQPAVSFTPKLDGFFNSDSVRLIVKNPKGDAQRNVARECFSDRKSNISKSSLERLAKPPP